MEWPKIEVIRIPKLTTWLRLKIDGYIGMFAFRSEHARLFAAAPEMYAMLEQFDETREWPKWKQLKAQIDGEAK